MYHRDNGRPDARPAIRLPLGSAAEAAAETRRSGNREADVALQRHRLAVGEHEPLRLLGMHNRYVARAMNARFAAGFPNRGRVFVDADSRQTMFLHGLHEARQPLPLGEMLIN